MAMPLDKVRSVRFGNVTHITVFEDRSFREYRRPYWFLVRLHRVKLESRIAEVYTKEHREKIMKRNGLV